MLKLPLLGCLVEALLANLVVAFRLDRHDSPVASSTLGTVGKLVLGEIPQVDVMLSVDAQVALLAVPAEPVERALKMEKLSNTWVVGKFHAAIVEFFQVLGPDGLSLVGLAGGLAGRIRSRRALRLGIFADALFVSSHMSFLDTLTAEGGTIDFHLYA